jgi:hypothetical protein
VVPADFPYEDNRGFNNRGDIALGTTTPDWSGLGIYLRTGGELVRVAMEGDTTPLGDHYKVIWQVYAGFEAQIALNNRGDLAFNAGTDSGSMMVRRAVHCRTSRVPRSYRHFNSWRSAAKHLDRSVPPSEFQKALQDSRKLGRRG